MDKMVEAKVQVMHKDRPSSRICSSGSCVRSTSELLLISDCVTHMPMGLFSDPFPRGIWLVMTTQVRTQQHCQQPSGALG
jgi:hypothetical protein